MDENRTEITLEKADRTEIKLGKDDTALVLRSDGTMQLFLRGGDVDDPTRKMQINEILVASLGHLLQDANFSNQIIEAFIKSKEVAKQQAIKEGIDDSEDEDEATDSDLMDFKEMKKKVK